MLLRMAHEALRVSGGVLLLLLTACGSSSDHPESAGGSAGGTAGPGGADSLGGANGSAGANSSGGASGKVGVSGSSPGGSATAGGGTPATAGAHSAGAGGDVAPPDTKWLNSTNNLPMLAPPDSGEVAFLAAVPNTNRVIAALSGAGLFVTDDGGAVWTHLGSGAGSAQITHGPSSLTFDPEHAGVFWESGIYGSFGDGLYTTKDEGVTFTQLGTIGHNDFLTIDFSDPARKLLLAGTHEQSRKLFKSVDGGMSWMDIGMNVPAGTGFSVLPLIIDAQNYLLGINGTGTVGVYRSANAGMTWASTATDSPYGWPLRASDGNIYWLLNGTGMIISSDQGKTWRKAGAGPTQTMSAGPMELPDGRIVTLGPTHVIVSADKGATWQEVGEKLPFPTQNCQTYGFTYSAPTRTFFINHNNCSGKLIADTIWTSGWDYTK